MREFQNIIAFRNVSIIRFVVVVGLALRCEGLLNSKQQHFTIGGWSSSSASSFLSTWRPVLQTYLTNEIGPLYDPPIDFTLVPYDYTEENSAEAMIEAGRLDFAYHLGGGLTCLQAQHGYAIIATQVQITLGKATSCYGSVIYSLKSNTAVQSLSDFAGKRLGVGYPFSPGSFMLGTEFLDAHDLNIYTSFSQVVFYLNDYAGMMKGILNGDIDVGMTQSGWLEAHYPENIPLFIFHNVIDATYRSEPYPFPTSTPLVPTYGLASAPHIPAQLIQQVSTALGRLNATHPAAKTAGIEKFLLAASYEGPRSLVENLGLLVTTPEGKVRRNIFVGLQGIIACPEGYGIDDNETLLNGCNQANLRCPSGFACFCSICHENAIVNTFPWQVVLGLCAALYVVGICFRLGLLGNFEEGGFEHAIAELGRSRLFEGSKAAEVEHSAAPQQPSKAEDVERAKAH